MWTRDLLRIVHTRIGDYYIVEQGRKPMRVQAVVWEPVPNTYFTTLQQARDCIEDLVNPRIVE